jgi:hypothetical protein
VVGAGVDDPFTIEFVVVEGEGVIVTMENGAFAFAVNEDKGLLAGTGRHDEKLSLDA